MSEQLSNLGYFAFKPEVTPGVAVTPDKFLPIYDETMETKANFVDQKPIYGNPFATFNTIRGQRSHNGDVTTLAEPNTATFLFDMFLKLGTVSGSGPYSRHGTFGASQTYTVDISTNNIVRRYVGVQMSKFSPNWNDNEMQAKISIASLTSFQTRVVSSVTGSGPYTVVLDTAYDQNPTKGLVVGDLIRFYDVSASTYIDATVATVVNGTSFTTTTNVSVIVLGDSVHLRPATVSFNLLDSFLWSNTVFGFGADATTALANATFANQTRVEKDSTYELEYAFESNDGSPRSGGIDPAALIRTLANATLTIKKAFDNPQDLIDFNNINKKALVIRHFAGANNQYELRITFNNIKIDTPVGNIKAGDVIYATIKAHPNYDRTDGVAVSVDLISNVGTIS